MRVTPITLSEAHAFVTVTHRTHSRAVGGKFAIAVSDDAGDVRGVIIVGRPVARNSDNGWTAEVTRCCTDGTRNACSMLYRAAWRAARAMGYRRLITYTLPHEGGASLRGAGFTLVGERGGGSWSTKSRPRIDVPHLMGQKLLWQLNA